MFVTKVKKKVATTFFLLWSLTKICVFRDTLGKRFFFSDGYKKTFKCGAGGT